MKHPLDVIDQLKGSNWQQAFKSALPLLSPIAPSAIKGPMSPVMQAFMRETMDKAVDKMGIHAIAAATEYCHRYLHGNVALAFDRQTVGEEFQALSSANGGQFEGPFRTPFDFQMFVPDGTIYFGGDPSLKFYKWVIGSEPNASKSKVEFYICAYALHHVDGQVISEMHPDVITWENGQETFAVAEQKGLRIALHDLLVFSIWLGDRITRQESQQVQAIKKAQRKARKEGRKSQAGQKPTLIHVFKPKKVYTPANPEPVEILDVTAPMGPVTTSSSVPTGPLQFRRETGRHTNYFWVKTGRAAERVAYWCAQGREAKLHPEVTRPDDRVLMELGMEPYTSASDKPERPDNTRKVV